MEMKKGQGQNFDEDEMMNDILIYSDIVFWLMQMPKKLKINQVEKKWTYSK